MTNPLKSVIEWWLKRRLQRNFAAGDVCVTPSGDGGYKIVKILNVDATVVHIRLYKERFTQPPQRVSTSALSLGTINDADGFGVGHLPLSYTTFTSWSPARIGTESLSEEELEGYNAWAEAKGGTWG